MGMESLVMNCRTYLLYTLMFVLMIHGPLVGAGNSQAWAWAPHVVVMDCHAMAWAVELCSRILTMSPSPSIWRHGLPAIGVAP